MIITISLNQNHKFGISQLISMSNQYNIDFNLKLLVFVKKLKSLHLFLIMNAVKLLYVICKHKYIHLHIKT